MTERIGKFLCVIVPSFLLIGAPTVTGGVAFGDSLQGEGEWRSDSSELISGTWSLSVELSNDLVQGRIKLHGSNAFDGGDINGVMDGTDIVFGVLSNNGASADFSGVRVGEKVKGSWNSQALKDSGTWEGVLR